MNHGNSETTALPSRRPRARSVGVYHAGSLRQTQSVTRLVRRKTSITVCRIFNLCQIHQTLSESWLLQNIYIVRNSWPHVHNQHIPAMVCYGYIVCLSSC